MHRRIPRLLIAILLVLAVAGHAGAVPVWEDDHHPGNVDAYADTDCSTPSNCLASDDDSYLYAQDHPLKGGSPIDAARKDPLPTDAVLHSIRLNVKLSSEENAVTDIMVWNGDKYETVAQTDGTDGERWFNQTVTDTIAKQDGEYPVRVRIESFAGGKTAAVDYMHLVFRYTKVGTLSYSTGNSDDSPVLGSSTVQLGETTSVDSTTVCSGGYCGKVKSLLRANDTAIGNVNGLSLTSGNNPQTDTLCDGDPVAGSCGTAELSTAWRVEGVETGAYGLD
ncbi:MAG: hypothetical protein SVW02_02390, partial [Candidatus Nanohaloarchaea archaeon]|nr:hypothetical protein [Candidatus Nanohaloarchaea archaeon]